MNRNRTPNTDLIRARMGLASDNDLYVLALMIRDALEGDSNDAEHDALVQAAEGFGIHYDPDYEERETVTMRCADEKGWPTREFIPDEGGKDFSCSDCGFMQTSFANGLRDLCLNATWHSVDDFIKFRDTARAEGATDVPDNPERNSFTEEDN